MPCLIHYSEAEQVVILEGESVRRFFPANGPEEWNALIQALKAEAAADQTVERINGASLEQLVENYRAWKAHQRPTRPSTSTTLTLEDLGL